MKATSSLGCSRTQPAHWDSHTPQKHGCFLWELGLCGRCTGVAVPLRVVPSPTGLPSKRGNFPSKE